MFKKLVGLVPFHPSSLDQLIRYGELLKKEARIRNIGLLFMGLGVMVQIAATIKPPQPTITSSPNDLLRGGFRSTDDAVRACRTNQDNFEDELAFFGISCADIATTRQVTLKRDGRSGTLFVLGRLYYAEPEQYMVEINDNTYWLRPFWGVSTGTSTNKQALFGTTKQGFHFYILYESGNLVFERVPDFIYCSTENKNPPCSSGCIHKVAASSACQVQESVTVLNETRDIKSIDTLPAEGGDHILYNLSATNIGETKIKNYVMRNTISDLLDYAAPLGLDEGLLDEEGTVTWPAEDIEAGNALQHYIRLMVKKPIPNTPISSTHPGHYDLLLTNYYGNATHVKLPGNIIKTLEAGSRQLPQSNTLTGLSITVLMLSMVVISYLRNKLLVREITILRKES